MFPDSGGQYVYMREAYGDLVGFLYGWMIFTVSNGGTIAALSVASASYLGAVFPSLSASQIVFSIGSFALTRVHVVALISIAFVTWVNVVGCGKVLSCRTSPRGPSSQPWQRSYFWDSPLAKEAGRTLPRQARGPAPA